MVYDVVIVGAGLSGLTAAALLAKRHLSVAVIESAYKPGGSCGIFKREDVVFEQGAAMLYGFGEIGFNPHRFVFNALEESIDMIKHDELYAINFGEHRIIFHEDINQFIEELAKVFPKDKENFKRFYDDMSKLYLKVIAENPVYSTPDVVKKEQGLKQLLNHPLAYLKFLAYMNQNTEQLLKKYFKNKEVFNFFDKLTSTYCYTTVKETPAILSSIMFVDNHYGGSYYPAGSTLQLVGKLEKVIEQFGGDMIYNRKVQKILIEDHQVKGVYLSDGTTLKTKRVVYSGNVWDLYQELLRDDVSDEKLEWVNHLIPTYPSVVLFAKIKSGVIPKGTLPIEMLIQDKTKIDEGELTVYILSLDDQTLCSKDYHSVMCIGPTFKKWPKPSEKQEQLQAYQKQKEEETARILDVLEHRFKGFKEHVTHVELSTPTTLERYLLKKGGAVAGPKQQLGQHMLKRLPIKGDFEGLYYCGESTTMGTGTPAVTVSGLSAANLILRELGKEEYEYQEGMKNYVRIISPPYTPDENESGTDSNQNQLVKRALKCQYCEEPTCEIACPYDVPIRDINRRLSVENFHGARKQLRDYEDYPCLKCDQKACEQACIRNQFASTVQIHEILTQLKEEVES